MNDNKSLKISSIVKTKVDKTKEPLGADVKLVDADTKKVIQIMDASNETGEYAIIIKKPGKFEIIAEHEGFISIQKTIEIKEIKEYKEYKNDIALTPIETGATIVLKNIFF